MIAGYREPSWEQGEGEGECQHVDSDVCIDMTELLRSSIISTTTTAAAASVTLHHKTLFVADTTTTSDLLTVYFVL